MEIRDQSILFDSVMTKKNLAFGWMVCQFPGSFYRYSCTRLRTDWDCFGFRVPDRMQFQHLPEVKQNKFVGLNNIFRIT